MKRVLLGRIFADAVDSAEAVERIAALVASGRGGYVVTPNVDHVVLAETDQRLQQAYSCASLSLVDGMPLCWMASLLGHPVPEKVSGSDLIRPLCARAARERWRVYFFGAAPGVAEVASERLMREFGGLRVVGVDAPARGFNLAADMRAQALRKLRSADPNLVFVALGCPKQEIMMYEWREAMAPAVAVGIGAGLDFLAGIVRRAPPWVSRMGLEWAFRLVQEPGRLARRYLVRDLAIAGVFMRMLSLPRARRAMEFLPSSNVDAKPA